jgi:hydroxyacylglutathione hydrolase
VRIGYDNIVAFADSETLERYFDEEGGESTSITEIDFSELDSFMTTNGGLLLDVRFSNEYDASKLPGALNASYTRMPEYAESRVPKDQQLLVHCGSGARAAAAAAYLDREGFDVVFVNGSFEDYAASHGIEEAAPEPQMA